MAKIKGSISIEKPVDVVFDEVSDIRNEPTYNPNMISAELKTEEPIGKGSQFSVKVKSRNDTMDMSIAYTEFRKAEYIGSHTISDNMVVNGGLTFSASNHGTLLEWKWDVRLRGNLKLFTPLISILGNRQENEIWQGLKAKLERQSKSDVNVAYPQLLVTRLRLEVSGAFFEYLVSCNGVSGRKRWIT